MSAALLSTAPRLVYEWENIPDDADRQLATWIQETSDFFHAHPALPLPQNLPLALKKECQFIANFKLTPNIPIDWGGKSFSLSLLEFFLNEFSLPGSLVENIHTIANSEGSPETKADRVKELLDRFAQQNLYPLFKKDDAEKLKNLFNDMHAIFKNAPHILFCPTGEILGVGILPELRQKLEGLHLLPTEADSTVTMGEALHRSYLQWICLEHAKDEKLQGELLSWMHGAKKATFAPLSKSLKSQFTTAQKRKQALYEDAFAMMNQKGFDFLPLRHIRTSVQLPMAALPSAEQQIISHYQLWKNQAALMRREFASYIDKANAALDQILQISCDQAEGKHKKGKFYRDVALKELQNKSPEFRQIMSLRQDIERFHRTFDSRMIPLERTFKQWRARLEFSPLLLTQLEATFRWMSVYLSNFKDKIEPLSQKLDAMFVERFLKKVDLKEQDGFTILQLAKEAIPDDVREEMHSLRQLKELLSHVEGLMTEMKGQISRLKAKAFLEASPDIMFEIEDWMEERAPISPQPASLLFEDEKEPVLKAPPSPASQPKIASLSESALPPSPQTLSGKMLQALPELIAPWGLSKIESKEVFDHLFLATQSMELLCQLHANQRWDLAGVCLHSYLIDCHVALEKIFKKKTASHSLQNIAQAAPGWQGTEKDRLLIQTHDQALLWARYPAHYLKPRATPLPPPLLWLQALHKTPVDTAQVNAIFPAILESYKGLIALIGQDRLAPSLLADLEKMGTSAPSLEIEALEKEEPNPKKGDLEHSLQKCEEILRKSAEQPQLESDLAFSLQEIHYYLTWMKQAKTLKQLFPHPKWEYWMTRVDLNMDKLFKHVLTALSILNDRGSLHAHNLRVYIDVLKDLYPALSENAYLLQQINLNIGHHYIHETSFELSKKYRQLLEQSEKAELEASSGFIPVTGRKKETSLKPLLNGSHQLLSHCLSWVLEKLPSAPAPLPLPALVRV